MPLPTDKYLWIKHPSSRESKLIAAADFPSYSSLGWVPGRTMQISDLARAAAATRCRQLGIQNRTKLRLPDDIVFTADSPHAQVACRRAQERLPNCCAVCGQGPIWHGKPLGFHVDHEDGNRRNNTWENLRKVCPNCHTQTETYGAKNKPRPRFLRLAEQSFSARVPYAQ